MKIVMAASEIYPFAMTGGLANVLGSLPPALEKNGHEVIVFMPYYSKHISVHNLQWINRPFLTFSKEQFTIAYSFIPDSGVKVFFIAHSEFFDRDGMYGPQQGGGEYPDNAARYSFFCRAVVAAVDKLELNPDLYHIHDWQTGLIPAYLSQRSHPAVLFTIHNLAYQGSFPLEQYSKVNLPRALLTPEFLEFWGMFNFMKSGIVFSDWLTTVSPAYSREILTPGEGMGLDGILRSKSNKLSGILNGIDTTVWNPETDTSIRANFGYSGISPRRICRKKLLAELYLTAKPEEFLVGVVTRLTQQKGIDLLIDSLDMLMQRPIKLAILGEGEWGYEYPLLEAARRNPGRISVTIGYDDALSRRIYSAAHAFLMPSIFEPCGLSQMIAMRYGSIPIVRKTGGLGDTVTPADKKGTGFLFSGTDPEDLVSAIDRSLKYYSSKKRWCWLIKRAMKVDNSWSARVGEYENIYRKTIESGKKR